MNKPWFRVKPFWGWFPATWQGYGVITAMFLALIYIVLAAYSYSNSIFDVLILSFPFVCLIITCTMFTALLTGIKPEFGSKNKGSKNFSPDNPSAYLLLACLSLPLSLYYFVNKGYVGSVIFLITFVLIYKIYLVFNSQK